jgi:hypothetical protein
MGERLDRGYSERRAEAEWQMAARATNPSAARAHLQLAALHEQRRDPGALLIAGDV